MKKILVLVLLAMGFAALSHASTPTPTYTPSVTPLPTTTPATPPGGPPMTLNGGEFFNNRYISLGTRGGQQGQVVLPYTALVNITKGDLVTLAAPVSGIPGGVTETTTAGDVAWIGVAVDTCLTYQKVHVAISGRVRAKIAMNVTAGDTLSPSGTAGALTETSSLTAATYTSLSRTPIVAVAEETNVFGELALIRLNSR
jgi:hypothetical protein